jgi:hypothetical protein
MIIKLRLLLSCKVVSRSSYVKDILHQPTIELDDRPQTRDIVCSIMCGTSGVTAVMSTTVVTPGQR